MNVHRVRRIHFAVQVFSGRADTVAGGSALLRVDVPINVPTRQVEVRLNGADVTAAFRPDDAARTLTCLLPGLVLGDNALGVYSNGNGHGRPTRYARATTSTLTDFSAQA